ncbi:MAG: molybdopterin-binding protein [Lachnospiraceae bacterium]|nr:molybdopterin-binding protein [Lachnospiraceae bacterium]
MKTIRTEEACGHVLAHDLTQIIPGEYKGARFKKGHIVTEEDIPVMLSMGKENLYVLELTDTDVHEDEAGRRIAGSAAGINTVLTEKGEGKVEINAAISGVLRIDRERLAGLNADDNVMFSTIHGDRYVNKGDLLAGTRVIPLYVDESVVIRAEGIGEVIHVDAMKPCKVGVVITGSEVYKGLIEDKFGDILLKKFSDLGCSELCRLYSDDDEAMIAEKILEVKAAGADFIAVTGGMSVDPDDRTPAGIRRAGVEIESYGAPVLPGAMFLLGYLGDIPVVGLPGCVMFAKATVFDLVVPRLLTGERLIKKDIKALAEGGLCRGCKPCTYPRCGFGC